MSSCNSLLSCNISNVIIYNNLWPSLPYFSDTMQEFFIVHVTVAHGLRAHFILQSLFPSTKHWITIYFRITQKRCELALVNWLVLKARYKCIRSRSTCDDKWKERGIFSIWIFWIVDLDMFIHNIFNDFSLIARLPLYVCSGHNLYFPSRRKCKNIIIRVHSRRFFAKSQNIDYSNTVSRVWRWGPQPQ